MFSYLTLYIFLAMSVFNLFPKDYILDFYHKLFFLSFFNPLIGWSLLLLSHTMLLIIESYAGGSIIISLAKKNGFVLFFCDKHFDAAKFLALLNLETTGKTLAWNSPLSDLPLAKSCNQKGKEMLQQWVSSSCLQPPMIWTINTRREVLVRHLRAV